MTTFRNRLNIHAGDESQLFVATVSKLFRFQTDIQPSLMFIQRAQKKVHLLMERSGQAHFRPLALSTLTLMYGSLLHRPASLSQQMSKALLYPLECFDAHSIAIRLHQPTALTLCSAAF
jgi:hypothetical protein